MKQLGRLVGVLIGLMALLPSMALAQSDAFEMPEGFPEMESMGGSFSMEAGSGECVINGQSYPMESPQCQALMAGMMKFGMGAMLLWLALVVFMVVVMWKIFVKAGKPGWAAIIPIYK